MIWTDQLNVAYEDKRKIKHEHFNFEKLEKAD